MLWEHVPCCAISTRKHWQACQQPCRYTEVLRLGSNSISTCKLLCNRSRAYAGALRYSEALQDASSAVAINSSWAKAHWRKAVALRGLKRFLEAVQAFHQASVILKGEYLAYFSGVVI